MFYLEPKSPQGKALWGILQELRGGMKDMRKLMDPNAPYPKEWPLLWRLERRLVEVVEAAETEHDLQHGLVKPGETVALCVVTGCNHFFNLSDDSDEYECPQHRRVLDVEPPLLKSEVVSPAERHRHGMAVRDQMLRVQTRNRLAQLRAEAAAL